MIPSVLLPLTIVLCVIPYYSLLLTLCHPICPTATSWGGFVLFQAQLLTWWLCVIQAVPPLLNWVVQHSSRYFTATFLGGSVSFQVTHCCSL